MSIERTLYCIIHTCNSEVDAFKLFQNNGTVRLQPDVISCTECVELVVFVCDNVFATDDVECSVVCANGNVDNADVTGKCFKLSMLCFERSTFGESNALFLIVDVDDDAVNSLHSISFDLCNCD